MQEINQKQHLIYCYSEEDPDTLVMLYPPERFISKTLNPAKQTHVLWIVENIDEELIARIEKIEKDTGGKILKLAHVT